MKTILRLFAFSCFLLGAALLITPDIAGASCMASQTGIKLPDGFPADIPLADDAFNAFGSRNESSREIEVDYQSDKGAGEVASIYRDFLSKADTLKESELGAGFIFEGKTAGYRFKIWVRNQGLTNVNITLDFPKRPPDEPVYTGDSHAIHPVPPTATNQARLKLPALFPKEIPFAPDAAISLMGDKSNAAAGQQEIMAIYKSKLPGGKIVSLYKGFTRNGAKKNSESSFRTSYIFETFFEHYKFLATIQEGSRGANTVTLHIIPTDGTFHEHYAKTDLTNGAAEKSADRVSEKIVLKRLVVGWRGTDPIKTNIFIRKDDKSLWGYGHELFAGFEQGKYGLKAIAKSKEWMLIDPDAYCLATSGPNYYVLKSDGGLWTFGSRSGNLLGSSLAPPTMILENVRTANLGANGVAVTKDGSLWVWGSANPIFSILPNPNKRRATPEKVMDNVADAKQSGLMIFVLKFDGSLWAWGEGNCGDGARTAKWKMPVKIMNGVRAIEAGSPYCCVIKNDNSLWVWDSQAGAEAASAGLLKPKKILTDVKTVSVQGRFIAAVKNDSSLWTYGDNSRGQCGIGRLEPKYLSSPRKIMDGVAEVSVTRSNAFALTTDGKIYGWGSNSHLRVDETDYDWLNSRLSPLKPTDIGFGTN